MSYQIYLTGGEGFTEAILPSLFHPSEAVTIARNYFQFGYRGAAIELAPDIPLASAPDLNTSELQDLLYQLQVGHMVLGSREQAPQGLFQVPEIGALHTPAFSPERLRPDLPDILRRKLQNNWPTARGVGSSAPYVPYSDSLAPSSRELTYTPEPVVDRAPISGEYGLSIHYLWPDGTGVAHLPYQVETDGGIVTGKLDAQGKASVEGLAHWHATVRLAPDADDDAVRRERKAIQEGLGELLARERKDAEARAQEYEALPWYQKPVSSADALFQGAYDAGVSLFEFVAGLNEVTHPGKRLLDGLSAAWGTWKDNGDDGWYDTFNQKYETRRHERWVEALGFSPSDFSAEAIAEAYDLASLVLADEPLRTALKAFAAEYAALQHHTEYTYLAGAVVFELVLAALLATTTLGAGNAAQAGSRLRHVSVLSFLGNKFRAFGAAIKLQGLRKVWRDVRLSKDSSQNHFEATARPRPEGVEVESIQPRVRPAKVLPRTFEEALAILAQSRKAILESGKAPAPKYTQAELHQIAQEGLGDERFIVRLVEETHVNRNGPHNGTLGRETPDGVQIWSTSFDQIAHLDTDPRLIAQALGVNYKPGATYKLAIVDQAEAVKRVGAKTLVPTYDNLKGFVREDLEGYEAHPELLDKVMTPEYSKQYKALIRDMPDSAWEKPENLAAFLSDVGLDLSEVKVFETRFSIQKNTGANEYFTGNGLTEMISATGQRPVFGAVEVFSLHKNPQTFRQMMGMDGGPQWVELVDLKPINLGVE